MIEPNFFIAFGIGLLSFLSPCILPVLPGYFSYLAGVTQVGKEKEKRWKVFLISLFFVLGLALVLVILGTAASAAGQYLIKNRVFWQRVGGLMIIVFGLQTMGFLKLKLLQKGKMFNFEKLTSWPEGKAFLTGSSFGLGWVPCLGPILGSILILAGQTQTLRRGMGLLVAYVLGVAVPMLFSGLFFAKLKILRHRFVPLISGGVLVVLGILLLTNQYEKLSFLTFETYQYFKIPVF